MEIYEVHNLSPNSSFFRQLSLNIEGLGDMFNEFKESRSICWKYDMDVSDQNLTFLFILHRIKRVVLNIKMKLITFIRLGNYWKRLGHQVDSKEIPRDRCSQNWADRIIIKQMLLVNNLLLNLYIHVNDWFKRFQLCK